MWGVWIDTEGGGEWYARPNFGMVTWATMRDAHHFAAKLAKRRKCWCTARRIRK